MLQAKPIRPDERSLEWGEGWVANAEGLPPDVNPYASKGRGDNKSRKRMDWFTGWYDAHFFKIWPDWLDT